MARVVRLSISLEQSLNQKLQALVKRGGRGNRSGLVRDIIRERLVREQWEQADKLVVATLLLIYDHHAHGLSDKLTHIQHHHHGTVLAATHVHLDHDLCAEMIMMKGRPSELRQLADELRRLKGVLHSDLAMSTTGVELR